MRYMLDTNICIYAIKHKPETVFQKLQNTNPEDVCISSVTYAELVHGVEKSAAVEKNRLALSMLLANMEILDFDVDAADCYGKIRAVLKNKPKEVIEILSFDVNAAESYGEIRAELERKGTPIGPLDMMIAAHAQSLGYTVVTNNVKEFSRVSALRIENWV